MRLANQLIGKENWARITFQHRIDQIQDKPMVKGCICRDCIIRRCALNQIIMLATTLEIEGLEYDDEVKRHKEKTD